MATTPTVRRLLLSNELKRLREEAGVETDQAAKHLGCRVSKISRIELAQNNIQAGDVKLLTELYGATPEHTEILLNLARGQNQRGRWAGYRAVYPEWFRMFVDLERDAATMRSAEVEIIPGLLQTESYIRALHDDGQPIGPDDDVESSVKARKERQAIFTRDDPPEVSFILSESCLRRLVGDTDVMREQLRYLADVARLHNVQIQVLPFNAKTYAGRIVYRFTMLNIPAPGITAPLEFVYVEAHDDARYLDDKAAVSSYASLWGRLQAAALGPVESRDFISEAAEQLG
ncbi:helix-turn-helix domain-containing protein [Saccharopolyspora sp. K220]|uniref:helix-turn-helix domain-containing protein n=1 Tax=Saccharopolyspora soli TaxID=2926618 RepID=UPI001F5671F4|nr:helix-turn-helix transcriptional regulator [Saccharopolyspora soli]MCI2420101.1 helix-turn-helix domain-containing protein [Saccharopolyspora soli]